MSSRYEAEIDLTLENNTHASLVRFVGVDKRVLELGAASGYMTRALKERGCKVTAVEFDVDAVDNLREIADETIIGDLNDPLVMDEVSGVFDTVLAGDVLEHLLDPLAVLRASVAKLDPNGSVVISVPNVAHADLRLALLQGRFDYRETGLLDETHLHFFTYETLLDLLRKAGLLGVRIDRIVAPVFETELAVRRDSVTPEVLDEVICVPESETYQFVVEAVLDDGSTELRRKSRYTLKAARKAEQARAGAKSAAAPSLTEQLETARGYGARAEADRDEARTLAITLRRELDEARTLAITLRRELDEAQADISGIEAELVEARSQLFEACVAESERNAVRGRVKALESDAAATKAMLDRVLDSRSYSMIMRYRRLVDRIAPPGTRTRSLYRRLARAPRNRAAQPSSSPITTS